MTRLYIVPGLPVNEIILLLKFVVSNVVIKLKHWYLCGAPTILSKSVQWNLKLGEPKTALISEVV